MSDISGGRCPFLAQLQEMPRLTEARYADGLGALYEGGAAPADVAAQIFDQDGDMPNSANLSTLFTTWGQFLDHDLSLSPENEHETMEDGMGHDIARSEFAEGSGVDGPRVQLNAISWQIDGNNIYGSNEIREEDVRSFEGGKLTLTDDPTSDRGLLPYADEERIMAGELGPEDPVFLAGDVRANENPNLLAMHTIWAREHNYWADRLAEEHPDWDDEQLFDGARQIVEYQLQKITYEEWLPHLIGNVIPDPETIAHDDTLNGEIAIEFSTAAFRFGHTMVSSSLQRLNEDGTEADEGHMSLMEAFFDHHAVKENGIASLFRGMTTQNAQELDTKVIDDLNFFLSTPEGVSGFSLVALNLLRGGDHGLQSYIDTRAALLGDIDPETIDPLDFSVITSDTTLQAEMAGVYDTVHDVDLWVGGLAEDNIAGTQSGPLFTFIIAEQFGRSAAADETFYQLDPALGTEILADVQDGSFSDVILRNTNIDTIDDDPFTAQARALTSDRDEVHGGPLDEVLLLAAESISDSVNLHEGDDSITITGGTTIGADVVLEDGNDTVVMSSGEIGGDLLMGLGVDSVVLSGTADVLGDVDTGASKDFVTLENVAEIFGDLNTGDGHDRITVLNKAGVAGTISTGAGKDRLILETDTALTVETGDDADVVFARAGSLDVGTGDGTDRVIINSTEEGTVFDVNLGAGDDSLYVRQGFGVEARGLDGNDRMVGGRSEDTLYGGDGDDVMLGRGGDDRMIGDAGDDLMFGGKGGDFMNGGNGADELCGFTGDDRLMGGRGADTLEGGFGDDRLIGGLNNDLMDGGHGRDVLQGGHGADTMSGGAGNDYLEGGSGHDILSAGSGDDVLTGNFGNDTLIFGEGTTTATGGANADTFSASIENGSIQGTHQITDFDATEDVLTLGEIPDGLVLSLLFGQGDGNDLLIRVEGDAGGGSILVEDQDDEDPYWSTFG